MISHCIHLTSPRTPLPIVPPKKSRSCRGSLVLTVSVWLQLAGIGPLGRLASGHCSHSCPVDVVDLVKIQLTHPGGASAVPPAGICFGPVENSAHGEKAGIWDFSSWVPSQPEGMPGYCCPAWVGSVGEAAAVWAVKHQRVKSLLNGTGGTAAEVLHPELCSAARKIISTSERAC